MYGYSHEEILEISRIGYDKFGITYMELRDHEFVGRNFKIKVGEFVVCEGVDPESGAPVEKRINISYKINGSEAEIQIRCQKGETRVYQIPKNATDVKAVNPASPLDDIEVSFDKFCEVRHHTIQEIHSYLATLFDKLEASKDALGLSKLAQKVINSVDRRNDVTGLRQRASQALRAGQRIIEEMETEREWFRISEAARKRKSEL